MGLKKILLSAAAALVFSSMSATISLPKILGSNMVLQQNSDVNLWGTARPHTAVRVTVSWASDIVLTTSDSDGHWAAKVRTPHASFEPQTVVISDGDDLTLSNILIGDVWICSGQSNMEMPVKGFNNQPVEGSIDYILEAKDYENKIHMFKVGWARSYDKDLDDCLSGEWQAAAPESVANTSAVAYFFAHYLTRAVNIPIGIITSHWGGTRIESWMPQSALKECVSAEQFDRKQTIHSIKPSELYCAMIAPIRNFTAKGFLWYQGESNLDDTDHYDTMMERMVRQWREDWGDSDNSMPFYYAQIAPFMYGGSREIAYPLFVEAQVRALSVIPNSGMAATTDIGDEHCIHPAQKKEVGQRLAALALAQTYRQGGFEPKAPQLQSYEIIDGKVVLTFSNYANGLNPWYQAPIEGFEIAGPDRVFHQAKAWTSDNPIDKVTVWSDEVKEPVAVRYAFRNFIPCNLSNTFGIPVAPFRTDDWDDVK